MEASERYGNPIETVDVPHIAQNLLDTMAEISELMPQVREAAQLVADAKLDFDMVKAVQVEIGFAQDHIFGKNAEERGRRELLYLGNNKEFRGAQNRLSKIEVIYEVAKMELEERSKMLGVWHSIANVQAAQLNAMTVGV